MGTVVQVEDFAEGTVYSNITMVDQGATLVAISGTIHEITA
jgi:MoaF-like